MDQKWERALRERIMGDNEILERRIQKIRQVLEILPPKCRTTIPMNKVQGIEYREIADQMGISVKTVESQMRIAFTKIRDVFKCEKPFKYFKHERPNPAWALLVFYSAVAQLE